MLCCLIIERLHFRTDIHRARLGLLLRVLSSFLEEKLLYGLHCYSLTLYFTLTTLTIEI